MTDTDTTGMTLITADDITRVSYEIVNELGVTYSYRRIPNSTAPDDAPGECVYEHDESPHCLVGMILHRLGVSIDTLRALDKYNAVIDGVETFNILHDVGMMFDDYRTAVFLGAYQMYQDAGYQYGRVLQLAEERLEAFDDGKVI